MSKEQEALAAFLDAVDAGIVQARRILGQQTTTAKDEKTGKQGFTYDPEKIHWEGTTGGKGPYQLATVNANADNVDFGLLRTALEENQKPIWGKQYFYWKLENNNIGRKPISEVKRKKNQ
jgi:hypothetical protein